MVLHATQCVRGYLAKLNLSFFGDYREFTYVVFGRQQFWTWIL